MPNVRAKFRCDQIVKRIRNYRNPEDGFVYEAEFSAVYGDTPENREFFEATPHGTLKLGTLKADHFTPGVEYYLDFTSVPAAAEAEEQAV